MFNMILQQFFSENHTPTVIKIAWVL